jgi:hypothetical protein
MAKPGTVTGWKLDRDERDALIARFPPRYANMVADHVTLRVDTGPLTPLPRAVEARLVGHADDGRGVECMVVAIDGATDRPDGSTYHITWSLADGRRARDSNDVLRERGWDHLDAPVAVTIAPARF